MTTNDNCLFSVDGSRIWIAGHQGMVGSAVVRRLENSGATLLTASRNDLDLTRQNAVETWVTDNRPDAIIMAAAKVGGIKANDSYPAEFLRENLAMATNVIHAAHMASVKKLVFLGSSCIYPKLASQPMSENALLTGPLEPTNEWYALAKIAGIKLCQSYRRQYGDDFISLMPTNLYGPGDNYHPEDSHVPAALLRRFHEATINGDEEVVVWGSGRALREFLSADDLADACIFALQHYSAEEFLNVGTGKEISIADLASLIAEITGYKGKIIQDKDRPDGAPRKLLDSSKIAALGWQSTISLEDGLRAAYSDFLSGGGRNSGIN